MPWIFASLVSAFFLGCYDLCVKHAVRENAVLPVLFIANLCSAAVWLALMSAAHSGYALPAMFSVAPMTGLQHAQLLLKSLIVTASWCCSYFAIKHLPVSIAAPIRATGPVWTLLGALVVLVERPTIMELLGIGTTLASFAVLSVAGRAEGIHFRRDKWIGWLIGGTLLNAVSGLYDKFLLGRAGFAASTVQAWFSIYLCVLFLPLALGWKMRWWTRHEFHWRWSVPLVSITLLLADFVYFSVLQQPGALISVVASLRRGGTLVAFAGGIWLFGERSSRQKTIAAVGVLLGIVLTILGK